MKTNKIYQNATLKCQSAEEDNYVYQSVVIMRRYQAEAVKS